MFDRRTFLRTGIAAAGTAASGGLLVACGADSPGRGDFVAPDSARVHAVERARHGGRTVSARLVASRDTIDLGGRAVATWTYGGRLPGQQIRLRAGEILAATLRNDLAADTSIHWHGITLRNDADGVPDLTQEPVRVGNTYDYRFTVTQPGTYWLHPHSGVQLDRGLYAPLIVEDPHEPLRYDDEWVVVLDDWLDGVTGTPDQVLRELSNGMGGMDHGDMGGMPGMDGETASPGPAGGSHMLMGAKSDLLGGDAGDVRYPYFLVNGRIATAPDRYTGKPGTRLRIRFINAGADTAFRVALGGHRMSVTHTDGYPVKPVTTDALLIGMGERYDVLVTLGDGVFPLVALAEGKRANGLALVRTGAGRAPDAKVRPKQLSGRIVSYRDLSPAGEARLSSKKPDRTIDLKLTGGMMHYDWGFNGRKYDPNRIEPIREGERVRLRIANTTTMWHPIHLHGHTFAVADSGVRKDTAIVLPNTTLRVDFDADNPGIWMTHCHNVYHAEAGMMTLLGYLAGS